MNSNYELFSLKKPTTLKKLETARKVVALATHPDKHSTEGPEKIEEYTEKFKMIEPAFERIKESIKEQKPPKKMKGPKTKDEWFIEKNKFPNDYTMTPNGDLSTPNGMVIELIPKVPASVEYMNENFAARQNELQEAQATYTQAKRELYELIQGYNASGKNTTDASLIMIANQKVHDAECIITELTKEPRSLVILQDIKGRDLHLDNFYDTSKLADDVVSGVYTTFHWNKFWMDKSEEKVPDLVPEEIPLQGGGDKPKKEKSEDEKARARKWAIINARRRNSFK
jgi:hypothetical protein